LYQVAAVAQQVEAEAVVVGVVVEGNSLQTTSTWQTCPQRRGTQPAWTLTMAHLPPLVVLLRRANRAA
jgi:hypothetical protein